MRSDMPRSKKRPQDFTADEKFQVVLEFESLSEENRGKFLRTNGLHSGTIESWKQTMQKSLVSSKKSSKSNSEEKQKIRELERELNQKNKVIAETTALLVLKKKANSIWGTEEGS
jgi:transposase